MTAFGNKLKELRLRLGVSLRAFCEKNSLDPGYISRLERGRLAPPETDEKAQALAIALGLAPNDQDWRALLDLAAAERGRIPDDLMGAELTEQLPALFRTIRGLKADGESLDKLVDIIRKA